MKSQSASRKHPFFQNPLPTTFFFLLCCLSSWDLPAAPTQRLLVMGGGNYPAEGIERFAKWNGTPSKAHVLIINWATDDPVASFLAITHALRQHGIQRFSESPGAIDMKQAEGPVRLVELLGQATGIYFCGGDQLKITNVLNPNLTAAFEDAYQRGIPFGGTSAGTAVMSKTMITGAGRTDVIDGTKVGVSSGLGLLANAILDQHFLRRQRLNRLLSVLSVATETLGLGIDEEAALAIHDNRYAEILGDEKVVSLESGTSRKEFKLTILEKGEVFDLVDRKTVGKDVLPK